MMDGNRTGEFCPSFEEQLGPCLRIKFLGRKKLRRRTNQLLGRIVLFREQRESLGKLG